MYTKDEVYSETLKYFGGDDLATNVFFKYCLQDRDENYYELTPDDMHKRIAKEFARVEKKFGGVKQLSEEQIYNYLKLFRKIVPQGSPLFGIGNNFQNASLSNCFVIPSPTDTMSGIFDAGRNLANLSKRRGGVGLDLSQLRPEGFGVSNSAKTSSGAWSFADFYSSIGRMVGQNGRRSAIMITMDIRHPDIEKFITMKNDLTKVTGANVSIKISDEFMYAVEQDKEFQLQWPVEDTNPKVKRTVKAKDLWNFIVHNATKFAEPGLLFWDQILRMLPAECYADVGFKTVTVNPCLTGDTWILTSSGPKQIISLINKNFDAIINGKKYKSTGFWKTGNYDIYNVITDFGFNIKATGNHKIKTTCGWKEVNCLSVDDQIVLANNYGCDWPGSGNFDEGWIVGQVIGDGCFNTKKYSARMVFWGPNKDFMSKIAEKKVNNLQLSKKEINRYLNKDRYVVTSTAIDDLCNLYIEQKTKSIKPYAEEASALFCKGFIRGFFDTDGCVQGTSSKGASIRLAQSDYKKLLVVQRMLARFGIISKVYKNRRKRQIKLMPNGKNGFKNYMCKSQHELIISKNMINVFNEIIGFEDPTKKQLLEKAIETRCRKPYKTKFYSKVKKIIKLGKEDVYDCHVDTVHQIDANGIMAHNCGEINLSEGDSCRLISLNLKNFVYDAFTSKAKFDFDDLYKTAYDAQRLSDDLVELEIEKLKTIKEKADTQDEKDLFNKLLNACISGRRTGLGTHGLADAMARMCIRYDKATRLVEEIYETIRNASYQSSVDLSKERGPFPVWDWNKEKNNEFIVSLPENLQSEIKLYGRRNISNLTNAPTGSISILSQTSSGIEPVFRNKYIRRKKLNHNEQTKNSDYVDEIGDHWIEFEIFHHNIKEYIDLSAANIKNLPEYFVTSDQIDWIKRIDIQASLQKYIDHSVSNTVNLPHGTSTDVVSNLYFDGWKKGLKGITVYVDGSRSGVLLTDEKQDRQFKYHDAFKRPQELECDIHQVKVKGEKWTIIIGLMNNNPYEVFGGLSEYIEIPKKYTHGKLTKHSSSTKNKSRYDLFFGEDGVVKNITKVFDNVNYQVHTRMVSLALRHGTKPSFLVEQLLKDPDNDLTSFSKVLSRVLKKYITDGTKVTSDKSCPTCNSESLIYQDGCVTCGSCGYSKCN